MKNLRIVDDGTLDTVFQCEHCSKQERYSEVERDSEGYVTDEELSRIEEEHSDVCDGPEDLSFSSLAARWHGGQFFPLYAYSSTGTVTLGLASEIRSCIPHAENNSHANEVQALKDFLAFAEREEEKISAD